MESAQAFPSTPDQNKDTPKKRSMVPRGLGQTVARALTVGEIKHYRGIPASPTRFVEDQVQTARILRDFALGNEPPVGRVTQGAIDALETRGANELVLGPNEIPQPGPFKPRPQA